MKFLIPLILLCVSQAFSNPLWQSRAHKCQNDRGFKRRLELRYDTPTSPVPCHVVWFREDIKDSKEGHLLIKVLHETGKCEAKEKAYLEKMQKWNVSCNLINEKRIVSTEVNEKEIPSSKNSSNDLPHEMAIPTFKHRSGGYLGLIFGGQFGHSTDKTGDFGYNGDNEEWEYNESGVNAAGIFGYNFSLQQIVLGPEMEVGYLSLNGNGVQSEYPGDTVGKSSSNFYSALRARIGFPMDRMLLFATGGAIGINYEKQVVDSCNVAPCGGSTVEAYKNEVTFGYTVGGGVERFIEKNWLIKLEYLYFKLSSGSFSGTTNLGDQYDWTGQTSGHIIRAGLNYHF